MPDTDDPRTMKTVETSWDVIHALQELDGARVTKLAGHLDMAKGTVYTHLATLRELGYVRKQNEAYHLSLHFLRIGEYVKNSDILFVSGRNEIESLAEETDEYVHLVREEHEELIYLYDSKGKNAIGKEYFERKFAKSGYFHTSAFGKSILAHLPEDCVDRIVQATGLPRRTANTITTQDELENELRAIRSRGYALNDEEEIRGVCAIGVPILDRDDTVLGAISLTKPTSRMPADGFDGNTIRAVTSTANAIEVNVQAIRSGDWSHDVSVQ